VAILATDQATRAAAEAEAEKSEQATHTAEVLLPGTHFGEVKYDETKSFWGRYAVPVHCHTAQTTVPLCSFTVPKLCAVTMSHSNLCIAAQYQICVLQH
jgi:hypothetical protein